MQASKPWQGAYHWGLSLPQVKGKKIEMKKGVEERESQELEVIPTMSYVNPMCEDFVGVSVFATSLHANMRKLRVFFSHVPCVFHAGIAGPAEIDARSCPKALFATTATVVKPSSFNLCLELCSLRTSCR